MFRQESYTGEELPPKCLCLTYDDGPGKNTLEIAEFLHEQYIQATFFVVGKYALEYDDVLKKVAGLGHLIGNHTFEHPDMPYYLSRNGDVQNQILRTDAVIKKYNRTNTIYFRSPYGKWSDEVAKDLNSNLLCSINHIGPIHWDIAGIDCYYWKKDISIEETVQKYLHDIRERDHGIVVMHDEIADMNFLQIKNKTLELTKQLIPILKAEGYTFVRLDEIKTVKEDAAKPLTVTIRASQGKKICLSEEKIISENRGEILNKQFELQNLKFGQIAIKASNGLYFSLHDKDNVIEATGDNVTNQEKFDLIPIQSNQFLLRGYNGKYLTILSKANKQLSANAEYMRGAQIFTISPVGLKIERSFSARETIKSLKRQFLYILSKIKERSK